MITNTTTIDSFMWPRENRRNEEASTFLPLGTSVWTSLSSESRRICGSLENEGVVIEWHNVKINTVAPGRLFQDNKPENLGLYLNLAGHGHFLSMGKRIEFGPMTAFLVPGNSPVQVCRNPQEYHRFLTINLSSGFLRQQLGSCERSPSAPKSSSSLADDFGVPFERPAEITAEHEQLVSQLLRPQFSQATCALRCKGIVLQLLADFLVVPCCGGGSSCNRQKCVATDRVRGVLAILRRDLADPPTLEEIGREVGCSPFYLSRTFSREMGMTIPQCLRTLRMKYAAELLKSGRCNVTEAATAVGYSSLSHFSQAFCQTIGCCPAMYSSQTAMEIHRAGVGISSVARRPRVKTNHAFDMRQISHIDVLLQNIG